MTIERELRDRTGRTVRVRVDVDEGERLNREIVRLANRAQGTATRRATSGGGVIQLEIVQEAVVFP